jgi:hypothetical protein
MVRCTLRDGPRDGEHREVPLPQCVETIGFESELWFKRLPSGGVGLVRGGMGRDSSWVGFTFDIYEKVGKVAHNAVEYRFLRSDSVLRCTEMTKQGKLCRNPAEPLSDVCRTHRKKTDAPK